MSAALSSQTLSPASPSPHRYDRRGWCNFERAEGQLIKPDSLCIDIGLFTTPLPRIGGARFTERTVGELADQGSYGHSGARGKCEPRGLLRLSCLLLSRTRWDATHHAHTRKKRGGEGGEQRERG